MATHFTTIMAATAMLAATETAAWAAGTDAQREACTPDAFRLCASAMPDEGRVETCLRAAGPRLSGPCHEVFYPQSANNQSQVTRGQAPNGQRMQPSAPDRVQTPSTPQMPPAPVDDDAN